MQPPGGSLGSLFSLSLSRRIFLAARSRSPALAPSPSLSLPACFTRSPNLFGIFSIDYETTIDLPDCAWISPTRFSSSFEKPDGFVLPARWALPRGWTCQNHSGTRRASTPKTRTSPQDLGPNDLNSPPSSFHYASGNPILG